MTTDTQYTAADFGNAIAALGNENVDPIILAALRIAQRVMTTGVIDRALMDCDPNADSIRTISAAIRAALTREET